MQKTECFKECLCCDLNKIKQEIKDENKIKRQNEMNGELSCDASCGEKSPQNRKILFLKLSTRISIFVTLNKEQN